MVCTTGRDWWQVVTSISRIQFRGILEGTCKFPNPRDPVTGLRGQPIYIHSRDLGSSAMVCGIVSRFVEVGKVGDRRTALQQLRCSAWQIAGQEVSCQEVHGILPMLRRVVRYLSSWMLGSDYLPTQWRN